MHRIIAAVLAASSCVTAQAWAQDAVMQQPVGTGPTLDQALNAAGVVAPSSQVAQAGVQAAQSGRLVAGLRPNPSVQSTIENVVGSGPYRGFNEAETTIGLAIPIELGGKRSARIAVADAQVDRALLQSAIANADVRLLVTQLYVEAVAAEWRLSTAYDQFRIAGDAADAARIRVRAGRASPIEEQRAEVTRLNAQAAMQRAERLSDAAKINLGRRIGQPVTGKLELAALADLPPPTYGPPTVANAAGSLALAAADADLAVADASVRLALAQRVPDVTVGPGLRRFEATRDTAMVFTISVPIPVFNSGRAAVAQAQAERGRVEAQRRVTALDVEQAITDTQTEAANAATSARVANGPALDAAQEAARIARIGYREGKFGQLDLLDAERTLAETRLAAIDTLATYQNAKTRLERLTTSAPIAAAEQGTRP